MRNNYKYIGILLFPFVLPLPIPLIYSSTAFTAMIINLILLGKSKSSLSKCLNDKLVILLLLFFLIDGCRAIMFNEFSLTSFKEVKIAFLVPIFFLWKRNTLNQLYNKVLISFGLGISVYITYVWGYILHFYIFQHPDYEFSLVNGYLRYLIYHYIPYAMHHAYIGMYIVFIIINIYVMMIKNKTIRFRHGIMLISFFTFNLLYVGSKSTILLLLVLLLLITIITYKKSLTRKLLYKTLALLVLIISVGVVFMKDWFSYSMYSSIEKRVEIYTCAIKVGMQHFFTGVGHQNVRASSVICQDYNGGLLPHNAFLSEFVANGIVGALLFILIFLFLLLKGFKKNLIMLCFVSLTFFASMTESILSRQLGVLFFVFFSMMLYVQNTNKIQNPS